MKICPQNPDHEMHMPSAKFCLQCGAKLEEQPDRFCECGQFLARQKFCHMCGRKTTEQPPGLQKLAG